MRSVQRGISAFFLVIAILAITVASAAGYFVFSQNLKQKISAINSFEECAKHYPVMESYPEQCNTPDGKHFVQQLSEEEKQKINPPIQTPSPLVYDETADWKTYVNSKSKYEIKYPSNWVYEDAYNSVWLHPPRLPKDISEKIEKEYPFFSEPEIVIDINSEPFKLPGPPEQYGLYLIKPTIINVDNEQGVYFNKICAPDCGPEFEYPYDNGNKKLHLQLDFLGSEYTQSLDKEFNISLENISEATFKEVISSLKVLK